MDDEPPGDDYIDDEVKKILIDSFKVKIRDNRSKPSKIKINQAIIASLSEFLVCFKLIGYDIDGNPVNMTITNTKMDKSALDNAFVEEITTFMSDKLIDQ